MNKGTNIAEKIILDPIASLMYERNRSSLNICVFISHKDEDTDAAIEIGNHIMNDFGYDIYLDLYDKKLQIADRNDDVEGVVNSIQEGLKYSTHLLCVVTEKSKESWWIPYEIGYAQANEKKTSSIKLKKSEFLPSFLRANNSAIFLTIKELDGYLSNQSIWKPISQAHRYTYFEYDI